MKTTNLIGSTIEKPVVLLLIYIIEQNNCTTPLFIYERIKCKSCAGTDRLSSGMRHSYEKPISVAAQVDMGQVLLSVRAKNTAALPNRIC
jgi:ribosomal protein L16/L10AE